MGSNARAVPDAAAAAAALAAASFNFFFARFSRANLFFSSFVFAGLLTFPLPSLAAEGRMAAGAAALGRSGFAVVWGNPVGTIAGGGGAGAPLPPPETPGNGGGKVAVVLVVVLMLPIPLLVPCFFSDFCRTK